MENQLILTSDARADQDLLQAVYVAWVKAPWDSYQRIDAWNKYVAVRDSVNVKVNLLQAHPALRARLN